MVQRPSRVCCVRARQKCNTCLFCRIHTWCMVSLGPKSSVTRADRRSNHIFYRGKSHVVLVVLLLVLVVESLFIENYERHICQGVNITI